MASNEKLYILRDIKKIEIRHFLNVFNRMIYSNFITVSLVAYLLQKYYILVIIFTMSFFLYNFIINQPHHKRALLKMKCPDTYYVDERGKIY